MAGVRGAVLLSLLFLALPAAAAELVSPSDCVKRLHAASLERIQWGDLALDNSRDDAITRFGELLARQERELDRAVVDYAKANEIELPQRPPPGRNEPLERLEGPAFDTAFLARVAQSNKENISFLMRTREQYADPTFRRLVNKALATYRDSQRELEKLYEELPAG